MKTNVVLIGFGPVGQILLRHLWVRKELHLVGIVDIDPAKRGRSARDVVPEIDCALPIVQSLSEVEGPAEVALVATASKLSAIAPTLEECARRKLHVVSTCEELMFPFKRQAPLAAKIDQCAKEHGVSILGTGINPGFLMDYLPVAMTAVCSRVDAIVVERFQDASSRRIPFQQKIGAGLTPAEFEKKLASGNFGHVGLSESAALIAHAMRWEIDSENEEIRPILSPDGASVQGIEQVYVGKERDRERIRLHFRAALSEPNPRDRIMIRGEPNLESTIPGAVQGDIATVSIVINAAHRIRGARAGLVTMVDVPCIHVGT